MQLDTFSINVLDFVSRTDRFLDTWQDWSDTVAYPTVARLTVAGFWGAIDLTDRCVSAVRNHWLVYGDSYRHWAMVFVGLVVMFIRAQMGRDGAYEELCEVVEAAVQIGQNAVKSQWESFKVWAVSMVRLGYELWLDRVYAELLYLTGFLPVWAQREIAG
jgi:hypothetical protein